MIETQTSYLKLDPHVLALIGAGLRGESAMTDEIEDTLTECAALVDKLQGVFDDPDLTKLAERIARAIEARKLEKGLGGE